MPNEPISDVSATEPMCSYCHKRRAARSKRPNKHGAYTFRDHCYLCGPNGENVAKSLARNVYEVKPYKRKECAAGGCYVPSCFFEAHVFMAHKGMRLHVCYPHLERAIALIREHAGQPCPSPTLLAFTTPSPAPRASTDSVPS